MAKPPIVAKGPRTARNASAKPELSGTAAKRAKAPADPAASKDPTRILPLSAKEMVAGEKKAVWPVEAVIESAIRDTQQPRRRTARIAPASEAAETSSAAQAFDAEMPTRAEDHQAKSVSLGAVLLAMQAEAAAVNAIALSQDAGTPSFAISQIKFDLGFVVTEIADGKVGIAISGDRFENAPKEQIQRLSLAMIDPNLVLIRPDEHGSGS